MPIKTYENTIHKDLIDPLKEECMRINKFVVEDIKKGEKINWEEIIE